MTKLNPRINYAEISDKDKANIGLRAAKRAFEGDVADGLTTNDSLCIVVGAVTADGFEEWGSDLFGVEADAKEFVPNIDEETGKLATALRYECNSGQAVHDDYDGSIPNDARSYTGGVFYTEYVVTAQGPASKEFGGGASGAQGHIDQATVYSALTRMGAAWALQQQARYGKPVRKLVHVPAEVATVTDPAAAGDMTPDEDAEGERRALGIEV